MTCGPVVVTANEAVVQVTNQGEPISPDRIPMIFDPLQRGDAGAGNREGLGLGLYIVSEAHGYTVRQAENGRIALDMIVERVPAIMLLDLEMPVMSGWEVLASLRRTSALCAITIVVLSAAASPPLGVAFMRKPCGIDELLGMLRDVGDPRAADAPSPTRDP